MFAQHNPSPGCSQPAQKHMILCVPNPPSKSASSSDIYLTGGRFVGNAL
jgi:hypothetical protein